MLMSIRRGRDASPRVDSAGPPLKSMGEKKAQVGPWGQEDEAGKQGEQR